MTDQTHSPSYLNKRSGIIACMAVVADHSGEGKMASQLLVEYSAPRVGPREVMDVMVSEGIEGLHFDIETGWRMAMCQLARVIEIDGDFEITSGSIHRTWSGYCVDALRRSEKTLEKAVTVERAVGGESVTITVYQEHTEFGPLHQDTFAAFLADIHLGRLTVKWSMAVGLDEKTAVARLVEGAETVLRTGQTVDLPYAHLVV